MVNVGEFLVLGRLIGSFIVVYVQVFKMMDEFWVGIVNLGSLVNLKFSYGKEIKIEGSMFFIEKGLFFFFRILIIDFLLLQLKF